MPAPTPVTGPFTFGKRSELVDGIEVIEFDLPYSNHAGFWERASVFLRYSWNSLQLALRSEADLVFATTTLYGRHSCNCCPLAPGESVCV